VDADLFQQEKAMVTVRERKGKRFKRIFVNLPLFLILVIVNIILVGWIGHIVHMVFTDGVDHMTLYQWTEHLVTLVKQTFEKFFASITIFV
jgi:hypothetical protein